MHVVTHVHANEARLDLGAGKLPERFGSGRREEQANQEHSCRNSQREDHG
jgi:hypothetical protein